MKDSDKYIDNIEIYLASLIFEDEIKTSNMYKLVDSDNYVDEPDDDYAEDIVSSMLEDEDDEENEDDGNDESLDEDEENLPEDELDNLEKEAEEVVKADGNT